VLSKVINENMESAKEEIIKKTLKEAGKMFEKMKKSQISSSMMSSNVIHGKVTCAGCLASPIIGNRYKCTVCHNFDYCESCEEKNSENHKHPFLKIRKPEIAPFSITCSMTDDLGSFVPVEKEDKPKPMFNPFAPKIKFEKVEEKTNPFAPKLLLENVLKESDKKLDDERKSYISSVKLARKNYELQKISDDQIIDALIKSKGNVDQAVCLLFSD